MGRFLSGGNSWFEMAVSRNDLPDRSSNQAGMVIPKPGRFLFPELPTPDGDNSCQITVYADGWPVTLRYGLYTKDETHLTGGTDELATMWQLKPGAVVRFQRGYDGTLALMPVTAGVASQDLPGRQDFEALIRDLAERALEQGVFDPASVADARERVARLIAERNGQPRFRAMLMSAYAGRCAISGCEEQAALEAAHIHPYLGDHSNVVSNGLLLRADIHTLFDRGLVTVDPTDGYRVKLSSRISSRQYRRFEAQPLALPDENSQRPAASALQWHFANVFVA